MKLVDLARSLLLTLLCPTSLAHAPSPFSPHSLPPSASLSVLLQGHTTALERVQQQLNLAKQRAEDATTQAQEGLREAKASKLLAQVFDLSLFLRSRSPLISLPSPLNPCFHPSPPTLPVPYAFFPHNDRRPGRSACANCTCLCHVHACMHTYIHIYIHIYIHPCIHECIHT